ncbi:biogenesis of lysosome-related organelles complex 1 subunit 3 [Erythrolamprus reginae]|uniref:biogenesis of lysosome-related organelles complex 1 subunit 3 n=1 Tax=Erythrolamprus reginae TaxID=121349 RepID=UPI00396C77BB
MISPRYKTVIQGEASETDSEEEINCLASTRAAFGNPAGVQVAGEASETDEEDEAGNLAGSKAKAKPITPDLPPLIVYRNDNPESPTAVEEKPALHIKHRSRYSSLLQQKLVESNARLYYDIHNAVRQVYQTATKEIGAITGQLSHSQNGIINASHNIRLVLDDLRSVADKIDIINSCSLLPDIPIEVPSAHT